MRRKQRVEWNVTLKRSNLTPIKDQLVPQVVLREQISMEQLIARIAADGCALAAETLQAAADIVMGSIVDNLVDGRAIVTPLGTFTPSVTGTWGTDRIDPDVRAQNRAMVNFAPSPRLRRALSNPLFHDIGPVARNVLRIFSVHDVTSGTDNERLTPGGMVKVQGMMLQMNGASPRRGFYLLHEDTGEEVCHIGLDRITADTRRRAFILLPADLPEGQYRLKVVSQCTTSNRPLKEPAEYTFGTVLTVLHS